MIRFQGRVLYRDGSEDEFVAGTSSVSAWERYALRHKMPHGVDSPGATSDLVIAHHALGIAEGVDAWIETVVSVELKSDDPDATAGAVPPTPPDPSPA